VRAVAGAQPDDVDQFGGQFRSSLEFKSKPEYRYRGGGSAVGDQRLESFLPGTSGAPIYSKTIRRRSVLTLAITSDTSRYPRWKTWSTRGWRRRSPNSPV